MTKSPCLHVAIVAALAVAEAGCADHPAQPSLQAAAGPSQALLEAAHRLGYGPELVDGETIYCQREELTGSMVPTEHCISEAALEADIAAQQETLHELQNSLGQGGKQMTPSK